MTYLARLSIKVTVLAAASLLLSGNTAAAAGDLTVTVSGIANTRGNLVTCLWSDKAGFPSCHKSKTAKRKTSAITGRTMRVTFTNVPQGSYAVSVEHDEDSNGKLKTNFIGMPKEGVGISNNPGGIPGWSKAQVTVDGDTAISVTLRYL